ncbi:LysR family transcriptional regulator [Actinoplanes sp. NBRC 101535]|uniref:LysR family transcriptional regulator n=1 Tax=Actinoplanes sp. NBRC 101535 TaxID=3032196 RepID=UPI0024A10C55|nr:LysR family transcriptional regulator [Actinoplanes sp. NBRC 101535]GLY06564.1 transcriptional regulator [Actinoplanes sp. NBRC 101535]
MLNTRRLHLLVAVADTGSIAGAAAAAGCSAAAASQQLGILESDLGVPLLERTARSVRLTHAGEVLVERGRGILADLASAEQEVHSSGGRLRVAAFATATTRFVAPALGAMRRRHPALRLTFTELEPEAALPTLRAGEIDVAVTHRYAPSPEPDLRGLVQSPLVADPMVLAVPPRLRPAGDAPVRPADFADAEWIAARAESGFQAVTESVARAAGFTARISHRADSYQAVLALVAADLGVALILRSAVTSLAGIALLEIAGPPNIVRQVQVTSRRGDRNPAIGELRRELTRRVR